MGIFVWSFLGGFEARDTKFCPRKSVFFPILFLLFEPTLRA